MADPFSVGLAAVSIGSSIIGGIQGNKAAKKTGKYNARLIHAETAEQVRRLEMQNEMTLGKARATIGASGVLMKGTPAKYLSMLKEEQNAQLDWLKVSGRMRAKAAKKSGQYAGQASMTQGIIGGLSTLTNAYVGGAFDSTTPDPFVNNFGADAMQAYAPITWGGVQS